MQSVTQKIRSGLLELRTPNGLLYASPTFWQRLYLLWTFRHFRSLSRRVLSHRQQELIDQLSETAIALEHGKVARASIIGAVEDIGKISPRARPVALPAADNLFQMPAASARVPVASAVGSELAPFPQNRVKYKFHAMRDSQPIARGLGLSAHTRKAPKQAESPRISIPSALKLPPRKWLEWASGAALGAALLGVLLYVTEVRPSSISAGSKPAVQRRSESQAAPVAPPLVAVPVSDAVGKIAASPHPEPAAVVAVISTPHDSTANVRSWVSEPAAVAPEPTSTTRVHVTGAPDHNFVYPESPSSTLTGTVNLRALIGPDGAVKHVDVLSGKPLLARSATEAVRHWRYSPPQSDGQASEAETRVTVNFIGDDTVSIAFPPARD